MLFNFNLIHNIFDHSVHDPNNDFFANADNVENSIVCELTEREVKETSLDECRKNYGERYHGVSKLCYRRDGFIYTAVGSLIGTLKLIHFSPLITAEIKTTVRGTKELEQKIKQGSDFEIVGDIDLDKPPVVQKQRTDTFILKSNKIGSFFRAGIKGSPFPQGAEEGIPAFCRIMSYGLGVKIEYLVGNGRMAGESRCEKLVTSPTNLFERFGRGYVLKMENPSHVENVIDRCKNPRMGRKPTIIGQIGEELSSPWVQTHGMIQFLQGKLELCSGFCNAREKVDQESNYLLFNVWLQGFLRVVLPEHNKHVDKNKNVVQSPMSPLMYAVLSNPMSLLGAGMQLWEIGKKKFLAKLLWQKPSIRELCGILHVLHLINRNIIVANERDNLDGVYKGAATAVASLRKDVLLLHKFKPTDRIEKMCLYIAENECIADLIINPVKLKDKETDSGKSNSEYVHDDGDKPKSTEEIVSELLKGKLHDENSDIDAFNSFLGEDDGSDVIHSHEDGAEPLGIEDSDLATFFINAFRLQGFQNDEKASTKGCADFVHFFLPSLAEYLWEHPDQAARVCTTIFMKLGVFDGNPKKSLVFSRIDDKRYRNNKSVSSTNYNHSKKDMSIGLFRADDGAIVDLLGGPDVYDESGTKMTSEYRTFSDARFKNLFGADKVFETTVIGNECTFEDDRFGKIIVNGDGSNIRRQFASDHVLWHDVPPNKVGSILLPSYFGRDNFSVWCDELGHIKICKMEDPKEVLYETETTGRLCDLQRKKCGYSDCYISFCDEDSATQPGTDLISRFESKTLTLVYYDMKAMGPTEIEFPRYIDSNDHVLKLINDKNGWLLDSNRNYRLINAPILRKGITQTEYYNPLAGYGHALWFENTDPRSADIFRCFLPAHWPKGEEYEPRPCIQVTLQANNVNFLEPYLRADTPAAADALAYVFLVGGEYSTALNFLGGLAQNKKLSPNEIYLLIDILKFATSLDKTAFSAIVAVRALSILIGAEGRLELRLRTINDILYEIPTLLERYIGGLVYFTANMRIPYFEEKNTLEQLFVFADSAANGFKTGVWKAKENSEIKKTNVLEKLSAVIRQRIEDLKILIENGNDAVRKKVSDIKEKKREKENGKNDGIDDTSSKGFEELYTYLRANTSLRYWDADIDIGDYAAINRVEPAEKIFYNYATDILNGVIEQKTEKDAVSSFSPPNVRPNLTEIEEKQFGATAQDFTTELMSELTEGMSLLSLGGEKTAVQIPDNRTIENLIAKANECMENCNSIAKATFDIIIGAANDKRLEETNSAGDWEEITLPVILHAYGMFAANGNNGNKLALAFLRSSHPWFLSGIEKQNLGNLLAAFFSNVETYLLAVNSVRHMERIVGALNAVRDSGPSARNIMFEDATQLILKTYKSSNLFLNTSDEIYGSVLLFEYMTGIRPRPDQIERMQFIAKNIGKSDKENGILIQQIMGSGKTKVIMPFLIFLLFHKGQQLPVIVSHVSQLPSVQMELPTILQKIGIRTAVINPSFVDLSGVSIIRKIRCELESMLNSKDCVPILSSHLMLTIRTVFRSLSGKHLSEEIKKLYIEFNSLLTLFEQFGVAIIDEVHVSMNPKESFIVQSASADSKEEKLTQSDVSFMVDFIFGLLAHADDILDHVRKNEQDQKSVDSIKQKLIKYVENKYTRIFGVDDKDAKPFARFICGEFDGVELTESNNEQISKFLNLGGTNESRTKHEMAFLRKLCTYTTAMCLSRVHGTHFGFNQLSMIVAYRDQMPTENYFRQPDETMFYYLMAIISAGFPDKILVDWVVDLGSKALRQANDEIDFDDTDASIYFHYLVGIKLSSMFDSSSAGVDSDGKPKLVVTKEKLLELKKAVEDGSRLYLYIKRAIATHTAQAQSRYFPVSYETTPPNIATFFSQTISMSGTLSNKASYHKSVAVKTLLDTGAIGQVACKLCNDYNAKKTKIVTIGSEQDPNSRNLFYVLNEWSYFVNKDKVSNLRLIIDYGGHFKDQPPKELAIAVATFVETKKLAVKFIEYFDPRAGGFVIAEVKSILANETGFEPKMIKKPSDRPTNSAELFTILDAPRSTGTDPFVFPNAHAIIIPDPMHGDFDGFLQAVMRARKFLVPGGQTIDCLLFKIAVDTVFVHEKEVTMQNLLKRMIRNTSQDITLQQVQATTFILNELVRQFVEKKLRECLRKCVSSENWNQFEKIRTSTAQFMLSFAKFDLNPWKQMRTWQKIRDVLTDKWMNMLLPLSEIEVFSTNEIEKLRKDGISYINQIHKNLETLAFEKHSDAMQDWQSVGIQAIGEQEQEQEQQIMQQQLQLQQIEEEEISIIATMRRAFNSSASMNAEPRVETDHTFDRLAPVWKNVHSWNPHEICEVIAGENKLPSDVASSTEHIKAYASMKLLFFNMKDSKIGKRFLVTENFLYTTDYKHSIFSPMRKKFEYIFVYESDSPSMECKCCFVTQRESAGIALAMKKGLLKNCYLCTCGCIQVVDSDGNESSNRPTVENLTGKNFAATHKDFIMQSCWMAHFFNADVEWLMAHTRLTESMFIAFGMPPMSNKPDDIASRDTFYCNVRRFLFLMSDDPEIVKKQWTINRTDLYSEFLAKFGASRYDFRSEVFALIRDHIDKENSESKIAILTSLCTEYEDEILFPEYIKEILSKNGIRRKEFKKIRDIDNFDEAQSDSSDYKNLPTLEFVDITGNGNQWNFISSRNKNSITCINTERRPSSECNNIQSLVLPFNVVSYKNLEMIAPNFNGITVLTIDGKGNRDVNVMNIKNFISKNFVGKEIKPQEKYKPLESIPDKIAKNDTTPVLSSDSEIFSSFINDYEDDVIFIPSNEKTWAEDDPQAVSILSQFMSLKVLRLRDFPGLSVLLVSCAKSKKLTVEVDDCPLEVVIHTSDDGKKSQMGTMGCTKIFVDNERAVICETGKSKNANLSSPDEEEPNHVVENSSDVSSDGDTTDSKREKLFEMCNDAKRNKLKFQRVETDSMNIDKNLGSDAIGKAIFDELGLTLEDIGANFLEKIPEYVDFSKTTYDQIGVAYICDMYPFVSTVHKSHLTYNKNLGRKNPLFPGGNQLSLHQLATTENRSLYVQKKIQADGNDGCGRTTKRGTYSGENQNDISDITGKGKFFVSISPFERTLNANNIEPFFKAIKSGNVAIIVDLRDIDFDQNWWHKTEYDDPNLLKSLQLLQTHGKILFINDKFHSSDREHHIKMFSYDNHVFAVLRLGDLKDGGMYSVEKLVEIMYELDFIEKKLYNSDITYNSALFHCHGGLGRSPSLLVVRILWKATKAAMEAGIGVTYVGMFQKVWVVEGRLNLAAVLRNTFIEGYWSRSVFCHTQKQIDGLVLFAQHLIKAEVQNVIFDKFYPKESYTGRNSSRASMWAENFLKTKETQPDTQKEKEDKNPST
jgi:hypothetical protein